MVLRVRVARLRVKEDCVCVAFMLVRWVAAADADADA